MIGRVFLQEIIPFNAIPQEWFPLPASYLLTANQRRFWRCLLFALCPLGGGTAIRQGGLGDRGSRRPPPSAFCDFTKHEKTRPKAGLLVSNNCGYRLKPAMISRLASSSLLKSLSNRKLIWNPNGSAYSSSLSDE